jgi:hypothetical protein
MGSDSIDPVIFVGIEDWGVIVATSNQMLRVARQDKARKASHGENPPIRLNRLKNTDSGAEY